MNKVVCDEMVDPALDEILRDEGFEVFRPEISDSDDEVLELANENRAVILTRDRDFVRLNDNQEHFGIIFDSGMHHRALREVSEAVLRIFDLMSSEDLENSLVRLNRFY